MKNFKQVLRRGWHDLRARHLEYELEQVKARFASLDLAPELEQIYIDRYEMFIELEKYQAKHE